MTTTMMFNPYSGKPRHPSDIQSDPAGILIVEPGAPMIAARPNSMACLREQIATMPSRLELLGGQQTRYVQLDEVLGWVDYWSKNDVAESNVRR
jgi:hypothetical protein